MALNKLNILFPIAVDETSITTSTAASATNPAKHLFNSRRDKIMRVYSNALTIRVNANKLDLISGVCLGGHNLGEFATVNIRIYNDFIDNQNSETKIYDSFALQANVIKPWGEYTPGVDKWAAEYQLGDLMQQNFYHRLPKQLAWKSIEIVIMTNQTYIDIGRLMIGYVFEPTWNYSNNAKFQFFDDGTDLVAGDTYRQFIFELKQMSSQENDRYEYELIKLARQGDALVCLNPNATGLDYLKSTVIMKRKNDISRFQAYGKYRHQCHWKEVI